MKLFKKKDEPKVIGENTEKSDSKVKGFFKAIGRFIKKHIKLIIILVIILAVVLYFRHKAKVAQQMMEEQANQPYTVQVEQMNLKDSISITGTLTANETTAVTSTLGGTGITGVKVKAVNFEVGDFVKQGDVVVEFDGDDYNRKIAELKAQYDISNTQSGMNIEDLQKSIEETQKQIDEKQKWLDDNKNIYNNLKDAFEKYEKYKDTDPSVANRWAKESGAAMALAEPVSIEGYEAAEKEIDTLKETIRQTQNKITLAQMQQNYDASYTQVDAYNDVYESIDKTKVVAPMSGYILAMNVEKGNNYTQGNNVFVIADTSGFIVEAKVNEYDIAKVYEGLPAVVKFDATGEDEFKGTVSFVSVASDDSVASSSGTSSAAAATGTSSAGTTAKYKVKIKLDGTDERLRVGMTGKASLVFNSADNVLALPYDCIQTAEDGSKFVAVVNDDGTKDNVVVTTGLESEYYVEVKGTGLKKGMNVEAVVTDASSTNSMDLMQYEE